MTGNRTVQRLIRKTPLLGPLVERLYVAVARIFFRGSEQYWIERYEKKGTSGHGSFGKYARFKAEVINGFVNEHRIESVIEFGCGDGNQLTLTPYPRYLGLDVSPRAIEHCCRIFADDETKRFCRMADYAGERAELALSLDVVYHLVEDSVFERYMEQLLAAATRYVIIYSSNFEEQASVQCPHVRHRKFTTWIEKHAPEWQLERHLPNKYPPTDEPEEGSFADFFIYGK